MKRLIIVLSLVAGSVALAMAGGQTPDSRMRQLFRPPRHSLSRGRSAAH